MSVVVKTALLALVAAIVVGLAAPTVVFAQFFRLISLPLDPTVGIVERVEPEILATRLHGKSALVVGGTRGIGRGIALTLAKAGANVQVVGRQGGEAVVKSMASVAPSKEQIFRFRSHDLMSVRGCSKLVNELHEDGHQFHFLIFTVGRWPDFGTPNNEDGINKVFALDVVARFAILNGVSGLLVDGARVMSVLASTTRTFLPAIEKVQAIINGSSLPGMFGLEIMGIASLSADTMLQHASLRYPKFRFVGTQPGVVGTDLFQSSFHPVLADLAGAISSRVGQSEEETGEVHANILSSPNLERRPASYFNYLLEARETVSVAYDQHFGKWLWSYLESVVAGKQ
jgi:NAD(P)-dependent dehydrogenase (short-subunit alcohol dehydrogenase family)